MAVTVPGTGEKWLDHYLGQRAGRLDLRAWQDLKKKASSLIKSFTTDYFLLYLCLLAAVPVIKLLSLCSNPNILPCAQWCWMGTLQTTFLLCQLGHC